MDISICLLHCSIIVKSRTFSNYKKKSFPAGEPKINVAAQEEQVTAIISVLSESSVLKRNSKSIKTNVVVSYGIWCFRLIECLTTTIL